MGECSRHRGTCFSAPILDHDIQTTPQFQIQNTIGNITDIADTSENTQEINSDLDLDIGNYIGIRLDDETRFLLLTKHFKPPENFKFPSRNLHGNMRSLKMHWLHDNKFLVYSKKLDSVFCLSCFLFPCNDQLNPFKTGFSDWFKIKEKTQTHANPDGKSRHSESMQKADDFKQKYEVTLPYRELMRL